jgi:hypothetical protein
MNKSSPSGMQIALINNKYVLPVEKNRDVICGLSIKRQGRPKQGMI